MKMELVRKPLFCEKKQRVLLLFEFQSISPEDEQVDEYLQSHQLEPKHQYWENRQEKEYLVYYFGYCYIANHIESLVSLANES